MILEVPSLFLRLEEMDGHQAAGLAAVGCFSGSFVAGILEVRESCRRCVSGLNARILAFTTCKRLV